MSESAQSPFDVLATPPLGIAVAVPVGVGRVRRSSVLRWVAAGAISVTAVVAGLVLWQSWRSYWLVRDVFSVVPVATVEELERAEWVSAALAWAWLGGVGVSGVAFVAWLVRARIDAGRICDAPHRLRVRWAVGAWVVPVVNLWWPQVVVADVWRASRPDTPARGASLRGVRGGVLVGVWWGAFVGAHAVDLVAVHVIARGGTSGAFLGLVVANGVSAALTAVAAASVIAVMWRVDRWQVGRVAFRA